MNQNKGSEFGKWQGSPPVVLLAVDGEIVEGVKELVYLDSKPTSDGYCRPEIMRRIGLASAVMSSLRKLWNNRQFCVDTKVHVHLCNPFCSTGQRRGRC